MINDNYDNALHQIRCCQHIHDKPRMGDNPMNRAGLLEGHFAILEWDVGHGVLHRALGRVAIHHEDGPEAL